MSHLKYILIALTLTLISLSFQVSGAMPEGQKPPESVQDIDHILHPSEQFYTSGQPTKAQLKALADLGVKHVVNLRSLKEMKDIPEASWTAEQTQAFYHIPIAGVDDLTYENVQVFTDVLTEIGTDKALLHCASSNRVGAMMALRAAWMHGESSADALQIGRQYGLTSLADAVEEKLQQAAVKE